MSTAKHCITALGAVTAVVLAAGCQNDKSPTGFTADFVPAPPPVFCANFRMTGGGRVDKLEPATGKNPPSSHDYATFGFEVRPDPNCPSTYAATGNIEWNEHLDASFIEGGGFSFHGNVTNLSPTQDDTQGDPRCGRFYGTGRLNPRNGPNQDNVAFEVRHACDIGEPGVQQDHIYITIGPFADGSTYFRHSLLTGGNIQMHKSK